MNERETHAEVIAEMRGAKTEFPFCYLMGEPDAPEIVDVKTKKIIAPRKINIRRVTVQELANRLEAAHERERGDCAKLREALEMALKTIRGVINSTISPRSNTVFDCRDKLSAAFSAPPRNCDRYSHDEALRVWASEEKNEHNGCFDEWLYEIAKEGDAK
jgi:hypothetical protein